MKTTPIRWWRDDATRYMTRAELREHRAAPWDRGWGLHCAIKAGGTEPELSATVDGFLDLITGIRPLVPEPWSVSESVDPIEDIKVFMRYGLQWLPFQKVYDA